MEVFVVGSDQVNIVTKADSFGCIREKGDWRQESINVVRLGIVKLGAAVEACSGAVNMRSERKAHRSNYKRDSGELGG